MISKEQFLIRQPQMPKVTSTDEFYLNIAREMVDVAKSKRVHFAEALLDRVALCLIGYYQDVIADAGLWRGFINECRRLYGFTVPFHEPGENYIDYEINRTDVRFLTWYALAMNDESLRLLYPHDNQVIALADSCFDILEAKYEDAPVPVGYNLAHELDMFDPEDSEQILHLGNWLFLHSYLLTPAYSLTLAEIVSDPALAKDKDHRLLGERLEQSMVQDVTGPLALYLREWTFLTVADRMPPKPRKKPEEPEDHRYYSLFTQATGGKDLAYFATYEELNNFLIEALGWTRGERHLEMISNDRDFVLMINRKKGLLVARNVAKCIADPDNKLYDKGFAQKHAFNLLTERGLCPADLLLHCIKNEWLPDAVFPGTEDHQLVLENADFIARCYLQNYYRADL